ncbi:sugar kinase [Shimia sp.]|uniref:sugar kinase n=1 Tax=Shimia sp. TaxID=1954381 RepID=UPI0025E7F19C|nr:sugar kinase [Shimia sp.]
MLEFQSKNALSIGEAMIEMAPVGGGLYQQGFAGDTFNTVWHMAQLLDGQSKVGFLTKVGQDSLSDAFVSELRNDGLDVAMIGRDPARTMGLYMIELDGVERSFHYWRDSSAARALAEDPAWLTSHFMGTGLIHLSGITLAILSDTARDNLLAALSDARTAGARVSFDPNIRPSLWASKTGIQETIAMFLEQCDIALPSFDDEQTHWGDQTPEDTLNRFAAAGLTEVVLKNGADSVAALVNGTEHLIATPKVTGLRDTSGAGDAFNAGYLSARLQGSGPVEAIRQGQLVAGEVIQHFGARIPKSELVKLAQK